jgi:membrane protein DedA with SNARE-associated domain
MFAFIDSLIEPTLAFVRDNKQYAFWIALIFAMGETTAFISIVIPSTAILLGVGALVATGELSLFPIWLGASIGAIIGSHFSYFIGWRYGDAILRLWPLRTKPELVDRGNAAFRKYGTVAVFIGHFFGPLRAVVFVMAGISRIPLHLFVPVNITGCLAWAYVTPKFGEVAGQVIGWLWGLFGI